MKEVQHFKEYQLLVVLRVNSLNDEECCSTELKYQTFRNKKNECFEN